MAKKKENINLLIPKINTLTQDVSSTDNDDKKETIDDLLIDDCLAHIFKFLPVTERIKIERVNKRWKRLSMSLWSSFRKLELDALSWGFRPRNLKIKKIDKHMLLQVLKRCGKFLDYIDISGIHNSNRSALKLVYKFCPNVKSLHAHTYYGMTSKDILELSKKCKNITELGLSDHLLYDGPDCDIQMASLFSSNQNLKSLKTSEITLNGSCLLSLPLDLLETLDVNQSLFMETFHLTNAVSKFGNLKIFKCDIFLINAFKLIKALRNCRKLEELFLHDLETENFSDVDKELAILFECNQNLRVFSIAEFKIEGKCLLSLNDKAIKEIHLIDCDNLDIKYLNECLTRFLGLTKLKISDRSIKANDKFLTTIACCTNLKSLYIFGRFSYLLEYTYNLQHISFLSNLEELILRNNKTVTDNDLIIFGKKLKKLIHINLDHCNITDLGLKEITKLPILELLSIHGNKEITNNGFNKMLSIKKIYCGECSKITIDGLKKIITESEKLEYLDFTGCKINLLDLVLFASEVTKKRTNNKILTITANSGYATDFVKDASPYLLLDDYSNYNWYSRYSL